MSAAAPAPTFQTWRHDSFPTTAGTIPQAVELTYEVDHLGVVRASVQVMELLLIDAGFERVAD